jgi:hypothetical protein
VLAAMWWCFEALRGQAADGTFAEALSAVPPSGAGPPAAVLKHATGGRLPDDLRSVG